MDTPHRNHRPPQPAFPLAVLITLLVAGAAAADNPPDETAAMLGAARDAVGSRRVEKTELLGHRDPRREFSELPAAGIVLIGFDVGLGKFVNIDTVYALRAVYLTPQGQVVYPDHGLFADKRSGKTIATRSQVLRTVRVRARPGYAVGGLTLRCGLNINGMSVTFMRINGTVLDPLQKYTSDWIGDRTGGSGEKSIVSSGTPVVGIFGTQDERHVYGLGLYTTKLRIAEAKPLDLPPPPVEKPVEPPKVEQPPEPPKEAQLTVPVIPVADMEPPPATNWMLPIAIFAVVAVTAFGAFFFLSRREQSASVVLEPYVADEKSRPARIPSPTPSAAPSDAITTTPAWPGSEGLRSSLPPAPASPPRPERDPLMDWVAQRDQVDVVDAKTLKARKEIAYTLFSVAGLQFVCGLVGAVAIPDQIAGRPLEAHETSMLFAEVIGIALVFAALGYWSWHQPLPAAVLGLIVYVGLFLLQMIVHAQAKNGQMMMSGMWVKIAIIVALGKCVSTAVKLQQR